METYQETELLKTLDRIATALETLAKCVSNPEDYPVSLRVNK